MYIRAYGPICHDLAKRLSHYLYFFFFSFILDLLDRRECGKVSHHKRHSHMNECGKVVHRPCSSCISSIENLMGTPLSSPC